jgi:hypothetical protein
MSDLRFYLSNQMGGKEDFNFLWFEYATADLRAQGHWVLSPHEILHGGDAHHNPDFGHQEYVDADIRQMVLQCNAIAVGRDWQKSEGARREVSVALLAGWPMYRVVKQTTGYYLEKV